MKTRKLISMVMAMTLLVTMAVCMPAAAEETTYTAAENAEFEMEGLSYTVLSGAVTVTDAAAFTGDTNATPKLKITHTENATTSVKTMLSTAGLPDIGTLEIATDFVITELTSGTGLTMTKIQTNGGREASTSPLTKVTDYWRTAMLTNSAITSIEMTVTFSGVGTVYLDNAYAVPNTGLINGDFKGLTSEFRPTAWNFSGTFIENDTDFADLTKAGWRFHQEKDGNYVTSMGLGRSKSVYQNIAANCVETGALYRITVNTKGDWVGFATGSGSAVLPLGDSKYASWTANTADWSDKSIVMKANNYNTGVFSVYLTSQKQQVSATDKTPIIGHIRNVRFEKVTEDCTVTDALGNDVQKISAGNYTVNYSYPLADIAAIDYADTLVYANDIKATASKVNGAESTTKLRAIVAVYQETIGGKVLFDIKLSDEIASKVLLPSLTSTEANIGIIPASSAPITVTIPDDGQKYSIKVLGWSSISGLKAYGDGVAFPAAE